MENFAETLIFSEGLLMGDIFSVVGVYTYTWYTWYTAKNHRAVFWYSSMKMGII